MTDRRRNTFVLLIVLGLLILSLLVIVGIPGVVKPKKTRLGLDLKGGVELTYQGRPTAQSKVTPNRLTARSTSCASASISWASPSRKSSARARTKSTWRCRT